jgi:hypothetical protein
VTTSSIAWIVGEPLRLTAAEWARIPKIEPPSGPGLMGFAIVEAQHDRDPAEPLMTHDEYLAQKPAPQYANPGNAPSQ